MLFDVIGQVVTEAGALVNLKTRTHTERERRRGRERRRKCREVVWSSGTYRTLWSQPALKRGKSMPPQCDSFHSLWVYGGCPGCCLWTSLCLNMCINSFPSSLHSSRQVFVRCIPGFTVSEGNPICQADMLWDHNIPLGKGKCVVCWNHHHHHHMCMY